MRLMMSARKIVFVVFSIILFVGVFATNDTLHCIANYELTPPMQESSFMEIKQLKDINADGYEDWALVYYDYNEFYPRDSVQIFFGSDSIDFTPDHTIQAHKAGWIGDVNKDGHPDMAYLRTYINNRHHTKYPVLYILYGGEDFDFTPNDSCVLEATAYLAVYSDIRYIGDLNGDDYDDICCGLVFDLGSHITKPGMRTENYCVEKMFLYLGGDTISNYPDAIIQPPFTYLDSNYYSGFYWGNYVGVDNNDADGCNNLAITYCPWDHGMVDYPERQPYITYLYYGNSDLDSMINSVDTLIRGSIRTKLGYRTRNWPSFYLIDSRDSLGYNLGFPYGSLDNYWGTYPRVDAVNLEPGDIDNDAIYDWCIFNDDLVGFRGIGIYENTPRSFSLPLDARPTSSENIKMNFLGNICGDGYDKLLIAEKTRQNNTYQIYCYSYNEILTSTEPGLSGSFDLSQNYPNPLNPTTTISYDLPEAQNIKLQVFDITGRLVETLYSGYKEAGHWNITWNAGDQSSGIYIYRLQVGDKHISRKMLLIK